MVSVPPPRSSTVTVEGAALGGGPGVLRRSGSVFAAQVVGLCCAVASGFLVAWMLGPDGKGLIYLVQTVAGVGLILFNFGLGPSAVYHLGRGQGWAEGDVASTVLFPSLLLGVLPAAVVGLAWPWESAFLAARFSTFYLWLGLAAVPALTLTFNAGYLCLSRGWIGRYNALGVFPSIFFCAGLVGLVFVPHKGDGVVAALWAASVALPGIYAFRVVRRCGAPWVPREMRLVRSAFRFGWRSHLGAVTQYLQHRVDVLLVAALLPLRDLGLYSLALGIAEVLWNLPRSIAPALMPYVANTEDGEQNCVTSQLCRLSLAAGVLLALALGVVASSVVPWLLPAFRSSVVLVWFLLPGVIAASLIKVLASDFNGRGRPIDTFQPAATALIVCAIAGVLVIPRYGLRGEALVTTAGYLLNAAMYCLSYCRMTPTGACDLLVLKREDLRAVTVAGQWVCSLLR